MEDSGPITALLRLAAAGDPSASSDLIDLVYRELRQQAQLLLRKEKSAHSLQPTALVHEAFMQVIGYERMDWRARAQFFAIAATQMRRILVDHARGRNAVRRGGGVPPLSLSEGLGLSTENDTDVLAVHEALEDLEGLDPRAAKGVTLRFFGGFSSPEIAAILGVSTRTVEGDWAMARVWLRQALATR